MRKTTQNDVESSRKQSEQLISTGKRSPNTLFWGTCPDCSSSLDVKNGEFGRFLGCSSYPRCEYTENLDQAAKNILDGDAEAVERGETL